MNIKIRKILVITISFIAIVLLSSCNLKNAAKNNKNTKVVTDCSAVFEQNISKEDNILLNRKIGKLEKGMTGIDPIATECKIIEFQLDNDNTKCEVVGSDKIDKLYTMVSENKDRKIILITPRGSLNSLGEIAHKYLLANGIDIDKYFASDVFNNMEYPYKGMKCEVSDQEFIVWIGDEKIILTISQKKPANHK